MKTATIKIETADGSVPRQCILQAIQFGLREQGVIGQEEEIPTGSGVTIEKLGKQQNGWYLAYAHITIHDAEGDAHFKEFYGFEDKDYLEMNN